MDEKRIEEEEDSYVGRDYIDHWARTICHVTSVVRSATVCDCEKRPHRWTPVSGSCTSTNADAHYKRD